MTDNPVAGQNTKTLSLIRLRAECKFAPIRVDFDPPTKPNTTPTSIIPNFNHDRSYFTPSFVLPADKKYYEQNSTFQKQQFDEKIQRSVQETTSILEIQPHPGLLVAIPNSLFCQVCQQTFQCYNQHINLKQHRTRTQKSTTSLLIEELCTEFRNRSKKEVETRKNKGIRKDSKRQEKGLIEKKTNKSAESQTKENESLLKGQNFSTCLVQDSLRSFQ